MAPLICGIEFRCSSFLSPGFIFPVYDPFLIIKLLMKISDKSSLKTRWLGQHERIPYDLLLLADETVEAINQYIADSNIYVLESDAKVIAVYVLFTLNDHEVEI